VCHYALQAFAAACGPAGSTTHFTLACRGPLEHRIIWDVGPPPIQTETITVEWQLNANAEAAGPVGQSLQPGTCAWEDRPLATTEPRILRTRLHRFLGRQVFHDSLAACNNNRQCVFIICVHSREGFLDQYYDEVQIKFPPGLTP
jgi:hypothetical protein